MQCPNCKANASAGAKFCPKCGYAFSSNPTTASVRPVSTVYQSPAQPMGQQPMSQPLYPDVSEPSGFDAASFDPFAFDGSSAGDSFSFGDPTSGDSFAANPYDQFQPSVAPQSLSMQQPSMDLGQQYPQYDPYSSQPAPAPSPAQYAAPAKAGSSSAVKKWVCVALDVVLMLLLTVAPWLGLDDQLAGAVQSLAAFSGTAVDTSRSVPGCGLLLLNDVASPLRAMNEYMADEDLQAVITVVTVAGVFLIVLWLVNMVLLVLSLVSDIKGRSRVFGFILPILTCFIFLGVLMLIGAAVLSEIGDSSYAGDVFSYMLSLTKFGLWATLITSIGGIVVRVALK